MKTIPYLKDNWSNFISIEDLKFLKKNDILLYSDSSKKIIKIDPSKLSNNIICYRVTENLTDSQKLFIWIYPLNELSKKYMTMGHFPISYHDVIIENKWYI